MRKLGFKEWLVCMVPVMYVNAKSMGKVVNDCSNRIGVTEGVRQGSVLTPLLFIVVVKAIFSDFCIGSFQEVLYANDFLINLEILES